MYSHPKWPMQASNIPILEHAKSILASTTALLYLSGCASVSPEALSPEAKRLIYQNVQEEIKEYHAKAEALHQAGYHIDAAKAYEMVNFYEGQPVVAPERIAALLHQAQHESQQHYKTALKYLEKDKEQAFIALNKMMRNNPEHKEGKALVEKLKKDPQIMAILEKKENTLQQALAHETKTLTSLRAIHRAAHDLAQYDEKNVLVAEAEKKIKQQHALLLDEAIALYNKGSLDAAERHCKQIQTLYPKDSTCAKYLVAIYAKRSLKTTLGKANTALDEKQYLSAIALAKEAMHHEPNNAEARALIDKATKAYGEHIPTMIQQGEVLYKNQDLKNAREVFHTVLLWDKENKIALTYINKIDQQLRTLKSLK